MKTEKIDASHIPFDSRTAHHFNRSRETERPLPREIKKIITLKEYESLTVTCSLQHQPTGRCSHLQRIQRICKYFHDKEAMKYHGDVWPKGSPAIWIRCIDKTIYVFRKPWGIYLTQSAHPTDYIADRDRRLRSEVTPPNIVNSIPRRPVETMKEVPTLERRSRGPGKESTFKRIQKKFGIGLSKTYETYAAEEREPDTSAQQPPAQPIDDVPLTSNRIRKAMNVYKFRKYHYERAVEDLRSLGIDVEA